MKIFITRKIPDRGIELLRGKDYEVVESPHDRVLSKEELISFLQEGNYDAVLCLLTDIIDADVLHASGRQCKIFANYAVGVDNINLPSAQEQGIMITNTPGVLTDGVAEHALALLLAIAHRIPESDRFTRAGNYHGWAPMLLLGHDVSRKTLGILGLGRIGSRVAHHAVAGFDMRVLYYDVKRNEDFERELTSGAIPSRDPEPNKGGGEGSGKPIPVVEFRENADDIFRECDFISIHVPLLPSTRHLVDERRLSLMKATAYLINTSRGPVVDEAALVSALKNRTISGAALDVFENEPSLAPGLVDLENVVLTPHTASATEETRQAMSELAAKNIIEALEGRMPPNLVKPQ